MDDDQAIKAPAPLKDYLDRDLEVGRFIVYSGLAGRSSVLQFGMIRSLHPNASWGEKKVGIYTSEGRKAMLQYTSRLVQVDDSMVLDVEVKRRLLALRATTVAPLVPLSAA